MLVASPKSKLLSFTPFVQLHRFLRFLYVLNQWVAKVRCSTTTSNSNSNTPARADTTYFRKLRDEPRSSSVRISGRLHFAISSTVTLNDPLLTQDNSAATPLPRLQPSCFQHVGYRSAAAKVSRGSLSDPFSTRLGNTVVVSSSWSARPVTTYISLKLQVS